MRIILCFLLFFIAYAIADIEYYSVGGDCNQEMCENLCLNKDPTLFGICLGQECACMVNYVIDTDYDDEK
ncbi:hypothetical protein TSAR_015920 [Trichomalopsis sarcophagae]|uniref:Invertebrate defensins family profile domain-containing protein n=1 Tax=Trichomalopsis sarcophagae TaxID=543379 RepID=A0A232EXI9_9HYME|nr:hypothetical protein TSAR_015920 [Trichomalopsis sarcophagae]